MYNSGILNYKLSKSETKELLWAGETLSWSFKEDGIIENINEIRKSLPEHLFFNALDFEGAMEINENTKISIYIDNIANIKDEIRNDDFVYNFIKNLYDTNKLDTMLEMDNFQHNKLLALKVFQSDILNYSFRGICGDFSTFLSMDDLFRALGFSDFDSTFSLD